MIEIVSGAIGARRIRQRGYRCSERRSTPGDTCPHTTSLFCGAPPTRKEYPASDTMPVGEVLRNCSDVSCLACQRTKKHIPSTNPPLPTARCRELKRSAQNRACISETYILAREYATQGNRALRTPIPHGVMPPNPARSDEKTLTSCCIACINVTTRAD